MKQTVVRGNLDINFGA